MSKEKQQLIQRWDNYILKIKKRCHEVIEQANQGTDMFIPQLKFDLNAIINAWNGIKDQITQLSEKLEEGWDKMDDLFDKAESTEAETDEQRTKKEDTDIYIQWIYIKNETLAKAKAAKQILFNVKRI